MTKHDQKLLEEILSDEPCKGECLAGVMLKYLPLGDDMILQLKMIEKFKYLWSENQCKDVGWEYSTIRFAEEYGKAYRNLWNQGEEYHHVTKMFWKLVKG